MANEADGTRQFEKGLRRLAHAIRQAMVSSQTPKQMDDVLRRELGPAAGSRTCQYGNKQRSNTVQSRTGAKEMDMTDLTRERELRERAREESDIFLNSDDWDSAQIGSDAEKELLAIKLAAFAQDEIASLQAELKELVRIVIDLGLDAVSADGQWHNTRAEKAEAELASARQDEREQNCKAMCPECADSERWTAAEKDEEGDWVHDDKENGNVSSVCLASEIRAQAEGKAE